MDLDREEQVITDGAFGRSRDGLAEHSGGTAVSRMWQGSCRSENLTEDGQPPSERAFAALAEHVANGSLYLWTDRGCTIGFRLDEPGEAIEQTVPLGELLDQAVYRNLPGDPRHREGYEFRGRGLAEMRALREVLAEALALIDRHLPDGPAAA
jgi:hypothetical protein